MAGHVIRPIPLYKGENLSPYIMTYLMGLLPPQNFAFYIWYIEGPKKKMAVDAGVTTAGLALFLSIIAPGATVMEVQSLEQGLGKFGLKPEEIDIVILTHLHPDHVELAWKFTNAKFIVQRRELDFAFNPQPAFAAFYTRALFEGLDFEVVDGDKEVVNGVKVLLTPGHTAGGQSVAVETDAGIAVITGFCCVRQNFEPPEMLAGLLPVLPPGIHQDLLEAFDSALKVKGIADIVVPLHEAEYVERDRIP